MTITKELFPKIKNGGYTARLHFTDEGRGEFYFDTEWAVSRVDKDVFQVTATVNYRGFINHDSKAAELQRLHQAIRVGDRFVVHPRKWNRRGARDLAAGFVRVLAVDLNENGLQIRFERA